MQNSEYNVEPLSLTHAKKLTDWFNKFVDQDLGVVENFHVTVESEEAYIQGYLNDLQDSTPMSFVVVANDGQIVGKSDIRPMTRYIDKHVVELGFGVLKEHPEAGRQLLFAIEGALRERKYEISLYFILARNDYFRGLFKDVGYDEVGKITNFYKREDCYDDRIILERILV